MQGVQDVRLNTLRYRYPQDFIALVVMLFVTQVNIHFVTLFMANHSVFPTLAVTLAGILFDTLAVVMFIILVVSIVSKSFLTLTVLIVLAILIDHYTGYYSARPLLRYSRLSVHYVVVLLG